MQQAKLALSSVGLISVFPKESRDENVNIRRQWLAANVLPFESLDLEVQAAYFAKRPFCDATAVIHMKTVVSELE